MATQTAQITRVIQFDFYGDHRRIPFDISEDAHSGEIYAALRAVLAQAINVDERELPALRYQDDEGDLCTLIERTMDDLLNLAEKGPLHLFAASVPEEELNVRSRKSTGKEEKHGNEVDGGKEAEKEHVMDEGVDESLDKEEADDEDEGWVLTEPLSPCRTESSEASSTYAFANLESNPEHSAALQTESEEGLTKRVSDVPCADAGSHHKFEGLAETFQAAGAIGKEETDLHSCTCSIETAAQTSSSKSGSQEGPSAVLGEPLETDLASDTAPADDLAQLLAMGFPEDQAQDAFTASQGDLERAIEQLIGDSFSRSQQNPLPKLNKFLHDTRRRLLEIKKQLQQVVTSNWELRQERRERVSETARQRLEHLQATLNTLRTHLAEFGQQSKDHTLEAAVRFQERASELREDFLYKFGDLSAKDKLVQLDARLADAQQFVTESLHAIHGLASAAFARASQQTPGSCATEEELTSQEAVHAAVEASANSAAAAIGVVDDVLREDKYRSCKALPTSDAASFSGTCGTNTNNVASCDRPTVSGLPGIPGTQTFSRCNMAGVGRQFLQSFWSSINTPSTQAAPATRERTLVEVNVTLEDGAAGLGEELTPTEGAPCSQTVAEPHQCIAGHESHLELLTSMGFPEAQARAALCKSSGSMEEAIEHLIHESEQNV